MCCVSPFKNFNPLDQIEYLCNQCIDLDETLDSTSISNSMNNGSNGMNNGSHGWNIVESIYYKLSLENKMEAINFMHELLNNEGSSSRDDPMGRQQNRPLQQLPLNHFWRVSQEAAPQAQGPYQAQEPPQAQGPPQGPRQGPYQAQEPSQAQGPRQEKGFEEQAPFQPQAVFEPQTPSEEFERGAPNDEEPFRTRTNNTFRQQPYNASYRSSEQRHTPVPTNKKQHNWTSEEDDILIFEINKRRKNPHASENNLDLFWERVQRSYAIFANRSPRSLSSRYARICEKMKRQP